MGTGLIFCVCDGCGWGRAASEAAKTVCNTFMRSLHENPIIVQSKSKKAESEEKEKEKPVHGRQRAKSDTDRGKINRVAIKVMEMVTGMGGDKQLSNQPKNGIRDIAEILLSIIADAHNNIFVGREIWDCGTTTVCAGMIVELDEKNSILEDYERGDESGDYPLGDQSGSAGSKGDKRDQPKEERKMKRRSLTLVRDEEKDKQERETNEETNWKGKKSINRLTETECKRKKEDKEEEVTKKGIVMVSVGDCKVYHFSRRTCKFQDLTYGTRTAVFSLPLTLPDSLN